MGTFGAHAVISETIEHGMAELVNLRTVRKRAERSKAERRAAENRQAFGASKSERDRAQAERDKLHQTLDGHRVEGDRR